MARAWRSDFVVGLLKGAASAEDYRPIEIGAEFGLDKDGLYHLSSVQTDKILQMALQKLTGLEQDKINDEYRQVHDAITDLLDILARPERVVQIMDSELEELKTKYGDARRSEIDYSGDPNFDPLDFVVNESVVVTLSREGYIKRLALDQYREQKRGGQGKRASQTREGDAVERLFVAIPTTRCCALATRAAFSSWPCTWCPRPQERVKEKPSLTSCSFKTMKRFASFCRSIALMKIALSLWQRETAM